MPKYSFDVDLYKQFLSKKNADNILKECQKLNWPNNNRRNNITFADDGLVYTLTIRGKQINRITRPWRECPILINAKKKLEKLTKKQYKYCAVMRYPTGNIGIAPYRDKEMTSSTAICGISIGDTRTMRFYHPKCNSISMELPHGSLYILKSPTNDNWAHEIIKEEGKTERFSLTFRDMAK